MKTTSTLRLSFVDEGGNAWNLSLLNPKNGVTKAEAQGVGDLITNNDLVNGKQGFVKTFNGATVITRNEVEL